MAAPYRGIRKDRSKVPELVCAHSTVGRWIDARTMTATIQCKNCGAKRTGPEWRPPHLPPTYRTSFANFKLI